MFKPGIKRIKPGILTTRQYGIYVYELNLDAGILTTRQYWTFVHELNLCRMS